MSRIKIEMLRLNFQHSECLIEEAVQEKMQQIAEGQPLEPIVVRFDGESYFVQDGFHRVEAARRCGVQELEAEIAPGTLQDLEAEWQEVLNALRRDLRGADGTESG